jgi:hypothetical protein
VTGTSENPPCPISRKILDTELNGTRTARVQFGGIVWQAYPTRPRSCVGDYVMVGCLCDQSPDEAEAHHHAIRVDGASTPSSADDGSTSEVLREIHRRIPRSRIARARADTKRVAPRPRICGGRTPR